MGESGRLSGLHVLVVDDNADAREIFRSVLTYSGALVTAATSAEAALKVIRHVRPDVILVDLAMPRRDGAWLIERVRQLRPDRGGDVLAVAVTAYDDEYRRTDMLQAGFHDYLVKPIGTEQLCQTIERLTALAPPPPAVPPR